MGYIRRLATVGIFSLLLVQPGYPAPVSEEAELVSYAQDLYRQAGVNIPRSSFQLIRNSEGQRIFSLHLVSHLSTLSEDLFQAFLIGGGVSQHARSSMDIILVTVKVAFGQHREMILYAGGDCCEKLFNDRLTADIFTEKCLHMN